ncbi:hypothetical protein FJTKL_05862 [Diaporthe vaccinii]|uniref:Uncharacterized protein n=1 Tax=Diaporthe vaccinii TaxID=105482 RepID=A0ABR4EYC9_9PEZI
MILPPSRRRPCSLPSSAMRASLQPASLRSSHTMLVCGGYVSLPPIPVHILATCAAISCDFRSSPSLPLGSLPNVSSTATRAAAATTPDCRSPPPMVLRVHRACLMVLLVPRRMLPIGAPRPLEKHSVSVSKHSAKSLMLPAPDAATSQSRAPSRCILMPCSLAHLEMRWTSDRGINIPFRVFSSEMTRVGQVCTLSSMWACSWMSSSVRWMPLLGRTHSSMAPVREDTLQMRTPWGGWVNKDLNATWLPIVPDIIRRPASLPARAAQ